MLTQYVGKWPFPITCESRMRDCSAPGCPKCKCRVVTIVRGTAQLAFRLLGSDTPELGADNLRAPHSARQSIKTTARCLIRGFPSREASRDYWPGAKALDRPAAERIVAGPQAEPSESNVDMASHARKRQSSQTAQ